LISALDGDEWSASFPCCFTLQERAIGTHWVGGRADPRTGLDHMEKRKIFYTYRGIKPRCLGRPACGLVDMPTEISRLHPVSI
jgi:hypothetical protein